MNILKPRQSFSSTDLKKEGKIGIVYPLKKVVGKALNVSSIIDHHKDELLALSEARLASNERNSIVYEQIPCVSFVKGNEKVDNASKALNLLDIYTLSTGVDDYVISDYNLSDKLRAVIDELKEIDIEPDTDFIKPENLVKKEYKFSTLFNDTYTPKNSFKQDIQPLLDHTRVRELETFDNLPYEKKLKLVSDMSMKYYGLDTVYENIEDDELLAIYAELLDLEYEDNIRFRNKFV